MKVIKLSIDAAGDGEIVSGSISKQRRRNGTWIVEDSITFVSGEPGASRTFVLDNDQRIVIEGESNVKTVYDRSQSAAVTVRVPNRVVASPPDRDGDEVPDSPRIPADEMAMRTQLSTLLEQERRDKAITEARERLKKQQVPSDRVGPLGDLRPRAEPDPKSAPPEPPLAKPIEPIEPIGSIGPVWPPPGVGRK